MPAAVRCRGIDMEFPLASQLSLWRLVAGLPADAPRVHALSAVSIEVPQGRIVGVVGGNGAGKSTLLRVLGHVYHPTRGTVESHGSIAGLFELGGLGNPHLTGRQYATRYLRIIGARRLQLPSMIDEIRNFSELEEAFDRPIRTYSSGMAARLYFATATAPRHDIYLIDELLSVGDEHFQAKCHERIRDLLSGGASGVLVTHDWSAVLRLCYTAYVMERGRVAFSGPSDAAIVTYLGIERPPATVARLLDVDGRTYGAETGHDARLPFHVEIMEDAEIEMSVSIEVLQVGTGWEIVILSNWIPIGNRVGRYDVTVRIPALPLNPGAYSLNVFLRSRPTVPMAAPVIHDIRSWTVGNGLTLMVDGPAAEGPVRLPYHVGTSGPAAVCR